MKITLVEYEIREAIQAYVLDHFNIKDGMQISMEFTATRGSDGLTASIDISKVSDVVQSDPMIQAATVVPVLPVPVPVQPTPAPTSVPTPKATVAAPVAAPVVTDPINAGDVNQPEVIVQSPVTMPDEPDEPEVARVDEPSAAPAPAAPAANQPTVTRRTLFSSLPAPSNKAASAAAG